MKLVVAVAAMALAVAAATKLAPKAANLALPFPIGRLFYSTLLGRSLQVRL